MLDTMYEFMLYIYRDYSLWIGMNISDNYVGILVYTRWLIFNKLIIQFNPKFKVMFSEWVYNCSIYCVYNQVSRMNADKKYVVGQLQYISTSYQSTAWHDSLPTPLSFDIDIIQPQLSLFFSVPKLILHQTSGVSV